MAAVSQWLGSSAMAWTQNLLGLCLFGCASDAAFLGFAWWLQFRSGWGTISLFLGVPKHSCNGLDAKPAGALPFRMRSRRSFLGLCLVAAVLQWLRHDFIVFRGSKRNVSRFLRLQFRNGLDAKPAGALPFRMRSRRSFLKLCLVAAVSQWLGHDFIVFRGSKSNVSRFLRLHSCNGLDAKPAGALLFRMRSRRSFLRLCLVAAVSQWLGHDFIVFRGSKSNVSRFLRLHSCNGLDAKPAGALPFRMRSRRSFLRLCLVADVSQWLRHVFIVFMGHYFIVFRGSKSNVLVADVSQWLRRVFIVFMGHDFIVFRGSKSNVSRFLRLHSCNGLDAKPAAALLFRMRFGRSFLRLCLVADVSQWLRHVFVVFIRHDFIVFRGSKSNVLVADVSQWLTFRECFRVVFCMLRARILMLFEAFAGSFPRPCAVRDMFFMDSKGDVPTVFQTCVSFASGTNPAAVRGFRMRFF